MKDGESSMEQAELLVQILAEIQQQNAMLQSTIDTLREQSQQKDEEIERLRQIILNLRALNSDIAARSGRTSWTMGISSSACSTRRRNRRRSPTRNPWKIRRRKSASPVIAGRKSARWKSSVRRCRWKKESLKRIRSELLTQSAIHADETVMQVHKEKDRPDTSESRMWVYSSTKRADIQLRCFEYRESRSGKWARDFLEGFSGVLITDGYSGYNKVQDAERAGCWAHMRRKWLEATPESADAKTCKAAEGYAFCNRLFELEHQFEKLPAEERLVQRRERSAPVLEAYWKWLNTISRPTGKLKDAVTCTQNQKAHLCTFLEHGEIEISNNQVENAIRPFVVGRKGWLFADTPQGAEASAIIYSLMETAKANSLRLDDYLLHLLSILPERAERNKDFEVDDLLP